MRSIAPNPPDIEDLGGRGFHEHEVTIIRRDLLDWYDRNKRDLPWRPDDFVGENVEERAYSVWVSEMMLQQTTVGRVKDYFPRWMSKWPSLSHLSQASQEEVNSLWAGLGYYRRARFLLEGAKHIVENSGGIFPRDVAELRQIPGIGNYTAGAIASIAFKQPVPAVDVNVIRVISRLRAISDATRESKLLWKLAGEIVDLERPGSFNQALMDLGSAVCKTKAPLCSGCPIAGSCKAFLLQKQSVDKEVAVSVTDFPAKSIKAAPREEFTAVCVVELLPLGDDGSLFLLVQRPENGLLAGLWEFPAVLLKDPKTSAKTRRTSVNKYLRSSLGLSLDKSSVKTREEVGSYRHVFSHIRLNMFVEWLQISSTDDNAAMEAKALPRTQWVKYSALEKMGLTSGVKKVFSMVSKHRDKRQGSKRKTP
ncbi:adenine DNA glycosylase isoform X1 [Selaginella moellendorffii]|uniref:adenine DNA glycosylase isoform X1 n=1 Tax=Selaginella moellendorffii TaxID=88036 RepID=UPI000D1C5324|nr:adenine DNA glycosylase isoform X1 [Selaginella moellendorffii]|eukprot:XP_024540384.1 adenine DNA glycosylase isoform X1 [Selaginella moellendorffii]